MNLLSREPVRVYVYGVALAALALLTAHGVLDVELSPLWVALLTALLAVPAAEGARARVSPVPNPDTLGDTP